MDTVDQLLFGYRDGHELIAASCRLPPAALPDVLPHVGAAFERADGSQLVGIWIESLARYLLARIWPAPELPRPGAVWAHALLLTGDQLYEGRLTRASGLLRRPTADARDGYGEPLAWPAAPALGATPRRLADVLVEAACAGDGRARIVLWPVPEQADGVLLALLDAFPAELRRELSFRTRQRARGGGSPYRLQVAAALTGRSCGPEDLVIDARAPPLAA